ncbi:MAG: TldD/PmbA family protein [Candidatus Edwardsbacteria bacterium]|nr:TldD/PmbA family protein [Candidatus Edwardsbacteria bacterium]
MEKLLAMARKVCDQAEVYSVEYVADMVSYQNAKLDKIDTNFLSGYSLRIIKDGRLGFAYTRNLRDRQEFLQNALDSLKGGVRAEYVFPFAKKLPSIRTYDPSIKNLSGESIVAEAGRVSDILKSQTDGEIASGSFTYREKIKIINTKGADLSARSSYAGVYGGIIFPDSGSRISRFYQGKRFRRMPQGLLDELIMLYKHGVKIAEPKAGRMKVLFMPDSLITLLWRMQSGTSSKNVYEKVSPISKKIGRKIFSERLTIVDDPLDDRYPGARAFDDEGVACKPLTLVKNGVLKSFYYDLKYAKKLKAKSTGHGYRSGPWGGDPISLRPDPALAHLFIRPGKRSFMELVKSMDRGIILEGVLGPHSGNIPNGDYSVGASPGFYVEDGEIAGRVKDVMVAGNIYQTLKNVIDLGDALYPAFGGWAPAVLCDDVSVATKK